MTVLAQDSFDRANGPLGTADFGGAWTEQSSSQWAIASNEAVVNNVISGLGLATIGAADDDVLLSADWRSVAPNRGDTGLVARWLDNNNYYSGVANNHSSPYSMSIYKTVAGVRTQITIGLPIVEVAYRLGFLVRGSELILYKDGIPVLSATDTDLPAAGLFGMHFWTGSGWSDGIFNDFLAETAPPVPTSGFRRYRF